SAKLTEHVQSISNVSSDASNKERINRWNSAFRMFQERPFFGWGPGTYVFQYAPFQSSKDKTIISTNVGNNGNAHSEYIGPLAESGLFGTLSVLFLFGMVFYKGSNLYHELPKGKIKTVVLCTLLGLFTYVVHGFLNNYLDTDKLSVPFWGFIALIVAIDVYHKKDIIKS
ncbi:MAG: O-antigen ligase family protein, partial [Flavobacteriales bacterium]|nr:O-antigen ligase family protein [Flavobacteriales bacterium]